jgi:hypothetical protein
MMKIVQDEPAPDVRAIAPDVPATLAAVVRQALEKAPDDRYAEAAQMAADLHAVRLEIAEQEEHGDVTTIVKDPLEGRRPPLPSKLNEAGPISANTLVSSRTGSSHEGPLHDFVFRQPEEISAPITTERDAQGSPSRRRRWPLIADVAVAAAVLIAVSIAAWQGLLFRESPPPRFRFTSVPEGANIVLNGVNTGLRTPADVQLARLPASIRLELGGYEAFVTHVNEEAARKTDRVIRASLVELPPPPPSEPLPAPPVEPEPTPPPPPVPVPRPLADLKVLRTPLQYLSCSASIGRSWKGYPFDGINSIRLPAQRYPIRIECNGQPPAVGEIQVPAGKNERNFNEVVNLKPSSESPVPR